VYVLWESVDYGFSCPNGFGGYLMSKLLCVLFGHKWDWMLPNSPGTVIGTQWCTRCKGVVRGVKVEKFLNENNE